MSPDDWTVSLHVAPVAGAGVLCQVLINRTDALWHLCTELLHSTIDETQFKERAAAIAKEDPFVHTRYLHRERTVLHAVVNFNCIGHTDKKAATAVALFLACFPSSASLRDACGLLPLHLACRLRPETQSAGNNTYCKSPGTGVRVLTIQALAGHTVPQQDWSLKDLLTLRGALGADELVLAKLEVDPACAREQLGWEQRGTHCAAVSLQCTALHLALLMKASECLVDKLISCFPAALTSRVQMAAHDSFDATLWFKDSTAEAGLLPGMLPLHVLARNGDSTHIMRALLSLDSSGCAVADECGHVPLHLAAVNERAPNEFVDLLLHAHPDGVRCLTYRGLTPLMLLVTVGESNVYYGAHGFRHANGDEDWIEDALSMLVSKLRELVAAWPESLLTRCPRSPEESRPRLLTPLHASVISRAEERSLAVPIALLEAAPRGMSAANVADDDGRLPLHDWYLLLTYSGEDKSRGQLSDCLEALISAHSAAAWTADVNGNLPLHCCRGADESVRTEVFGSRSVGVCTAAPAWAVRVIYETWPGAALQPNIKGKNPLELVLAGAVQEVRSCPFLHGRKQPERAAFVREMRRCHSEAADAKAQREAREQEFAAAAAAAEAAAAALIQEEMAATRPAVVPASRQRAKQRTARQKKSTNKPSSSAVQPVSTLESPPSPSDDHNLGHETQAHVEDSPDAPSVINVTEQAKGAMEPMAPVLTDSSMRSPVAASSPEPPDEFVCPITIELMTDPVLATDGHTYERSAIERWFATGKMSSPKTGEPLEATAVFPNHSLRSMIRDWEEVRRQLCL